MEILNLQKSEKLSLTLHRVNEYFIFLYKIASAICTQQEQSFVRVVGGGNPIAGQRLVHVLVDLTMLTVPDAVLFREQVIEKL